MLIDEHFFTEGFPVQIVNARSTSKRKLIHGVGVNDAPYLVYAKVKGKTVVCPFYKRWCNIMTRCYNEVFQSRKPTYKGCHVHSDWYSFMSFRKWMVNQDWVGKELDKDLLFKGNKLYGPETCVFITTQLNNFLCCDKSNGELPTGVSFHKKSGRYSAEIRIDTRRVSLKYHDTPHEAYEAWLEAKKAQSRVLAKEQTDERIANALLVRYDKFFKGDNGEVQTS